MVSFLHSTGRMINWRGEWGLRAQGRRGAFRWVIDSKIAKIGVQINDSKINRKIFTKG